MRLWSGCRRGVALVLGVWALTVAGCAQKTGVADTDDAIPAIVDVRVAHVETRELADEVTASGQWRAANELPVTAPFAAAVEALEPRPGDHVRRGQRLGALVTRDSRAAMRGAELMLAQASDSSARAEAHRALDLARHDVVRVPLVAPSDGVITKRLAEPGAEVAEGAELLHMVAGRDVIFEAHVAFADAQHLRAGQTATVNLDGGGTIATVVQRLLPGSSAADQSALVWLSARSRVPPDVIDRFGTATFAIGGVRRVPAVPDSALVTDDLTGETRVARVDAMGRAVWVTVRLGAVSPGWHELLAPALPPGTALVISGQRGLPDSTRVRVHA